MSFGERVSIEFFLGGSKHLAASGQVGEECFDLIFLMVKVVPGLQIVEMDITFDPIAVEAFVMVWNNDVVV